MLAEAPAPLGASRVVAISNMVHIGERGQSLLQPILYSEPPFDN